MKRRNIPLNALRAFESAARHGKMLDAGNELCVSHSAISRQVKRLEEILDTKLFCGPKNNIRLTPEGERLLLDLTSAFDMLEASIETFDRSNGQSINLSCLGTLSMKWLIPKLKDFYLEYPDIKINLTADDNPVNLAKDNIDIAIRIGRTQSDNQDILIEMFDDYVGPVCSPSLINPNETFTECLLSKPLLHTITRQNAWDDWSSHTYKIKSKQQQIVYEHFYFMIEAAMSGLGIAIAPYILVKNELKMGNLIAPLGFKKNNLKYHILHKSTVNKPIQNLINWLITQSQLESDLLFNELSNSN
ncbi:LysR substrate-binding domain-containing protein [Celerinatantimonas diazotrophica]|uniref:DNA-binding transcriptional LysR family regulator n=1 Tax=Celerinatantimonas diazotrophica TaxID=412034 RepID=A0A4R1JAA0_9GAMM|nr:LysR substrate-binding domain-containing protein [Celerinatantimonas diazotrophica]TCK47552.1 DNA-binding transcriptional LysR family regulator [Celerinatantimonas diazotrophica]CAG9296830.1 HTH-type transcriptional regulator TrpI [Celerinatantimonas diazotrophica]